MNSLEKLRQITKDDKDRVSNLISSAGKTDAILIEKLHSITQWFSIFEKSYNDYIITEIKKEELDEQVVELSKYLTICNGILDTYEGLSHIVKDLFDHKDKKNRDSFKNMRKNNQEHDNYFGIDNYNDDKYFKHIRAVCGQHPTNLNYSDCRAFASWPFKSQKPFVSNDSDLNFKIYYNIKEKPYGIRFFFYYCDLEEYISKLFERIELLVDRIYKEIY